MSWQSHQAFRKKSAAIVKQITTRDLGGGVREVSISRYRAGQLVGTGTRCVTGQPDKAVLSRRLGAAVATQPPVLLSRLTTARRIPFSRFPQLPARHGNSLEKHP